MPNNTDTDFNADRTITLPEADWLAIAMSLQHHAKTQAALGWEQTAKNVRDLADLVAPR